MCKLNLWPFERYAWLSVNVKFAKDVPVHVQTCGTEGVLWQLMTHDPLTTARYAGGFAAVAMARETRRPKRLTEK